MNQMAFTKPIVTAGLQNRLTPATDAEPVAEMNMNQPFHEKFLALRSGRWFERGWGAHFWLWLLGR